MSRKYPDLIYKEWTKQHYRVGVGEHKRLNRAALIDIECARLSTSWGMFQIMGFNFKDAGYSSVSEMVNSFISKGEQEHLKAFITLLVNQGMIAPLKALNWAKFARMYNGPGYAKNEYDKKLAEAYLKYSGKVV